MNPQRAASLLGASPLFAGLDAQQLGEVVGASVTRRYGTGQYVFHQGDPGHALVVVAEGLVKVTVTTPDGEDLILTTLGPTGVFGELALIDGGPRSASVVAAEDTTVLTLSRAALLDLLTRRPMVTDALLCALGATIRRLSDQVTDVVFLDLPGRVAKLLGELAERSGAGGSGPPVVDLPLTQSELAAMVGGSRQSVNQILQEFETRGWITRRGRELVVDDPTALRRRAAR